MVILQCSQTFSFAEKKHTTINGRNHILQSANPCIFTSAQGYMLNTRWINSGYRKDGRSRPPTRPWVSVNSLVRLDEELMPRHKQTTYEEDWAAQAHQWAVGLQDVRFIYHNGTVFFLAAKPVGKRICQVFGTCSNIGPLYLGDHTVIKPTFPNPVGPVEKNWVFFPRKTQLSIVHSWHPLSICSIDRRKNELIRTQAIDTPAAFRDFRGSTSAFELDGHHAFVVHTVHKKTIAARKQVLDYWHRVVLLSEEGRPIRYSEPFKFGTKNIEYCIGAIRKDDAIVFSGSIQDAVCCIWIISESMLLTQLRWSKL